MSFTDADAAALYDKLNPWDGVDAAFYDGLVDEARDVLDVGCGTGQMLVSARGRGHSGRLVGLDPDGGALDRARGRGLSGVEWVQGKAEDMRFAAEFDLVVMASNAFQFLVTDDELLKSLVAIRKSLRVGGRFAFDTRYLGAREWEQWPLAEIAIDDLLVTYDVERVDGGVVTFAESTSRGGEVVRVDRASLRFLGVEELNAALAGAGFEVVGQFGDWRRGAVTALSRSVVTVCVPGP